MKHFLILLLSVLTFCANAQVTISDSVARYFLQQSARVKVYKKSVKIKDSQIATLDAIIKSQTDIITTYKNDSITYNERIFIETSRGNHLDSLLEKRKKENIKMRRKTCIAIGAGTGAILGSTIGPEGTLIGTALGSGIGFVVSIFRKKDD